MPSLGKLADVAASYDPKPGIHYHLGCYVRDGGVTPSPFEGWTTFATIFQRRPDKHRFAIARQLELVNEETLFHRLSDDWVCWDLLTDQLTGGVNLHRGLSAPAPLWVGPSEDALIMKAMALYGRG